MCQIRLQVRTGTAVGAVPVPGRRGIIPIAATCTIDSLDLVPYS